MYAQGIIKVSRWRAYVTSMEKSVKTPFKKYIRAVFVDVHWSEHIHAFFYNAHSKQNREKFRYQILDSQDRVRMFALVPTFYSRVNFLLDRLANLSDLRYDLARRIFHRHRMKDMHDRAKNRI